MARTIERRDAVDTDAHQATPRQYGIQVESLKKHFRRRNGDEVAAVDGVAFSVPRGEFWALLGPSGCGKTTLLRCIAGLERPDEGEIHLDGRRVYGSAPREDVPVERRGIGMVFQSYALFPHMSVRRNVAFPLTTRGRRRRYDRAEIERRVRAALDSVGIGELLDQPIDQLSGGQQQRVSLARAIVAGNDVILFDEPLSNVDAKVREQLRIEIRALQRSLGFTALYVTHDQQEAMEVADRIAILERGRIAQLGSVTDVYDAPASRYVAEFVGVSNILDGRLLEAGAEPVAETPIGPVRVGADGGRRAGDPVSVVSRAHRWSLAPAATDNRPNHWRGTVDSVAFVGSHRQVLVTVAGERLRIWIDADDIGVREGEEVVVTIDPSHCRVLAGA